MASPWGGVVSKGEGGERGGVGGGGEGGGGGGAGLVGADGRQEARRLQQAGLTLRVQYSPFLVAWVA